jgi:photosystem II stability/assembly factor-like uncharacterized protein
MKYLLFFFTFFVATNAKAQIKPFASSQDSLLWSQTKYRLIGPFRGGRATAVCGSLIDKQLFYMGSTGGGVWRTRDGGNNWDNISDKYFGGSIGSIAIAPSNENIIYVGEGENSMRGNVSEGINGVWKSENAGRTWKNIGLKNGRHITNILVHPKDANIIWACVMGSIFGPSKDRGVYKSIDGGINWRQVLFSGNPQAGAIEITMEPNNPEVLYASTWQFIRKPYAMESGGPASGLYKSTDGGEHWVNISKNEGLPKDSILGISHIAVAPSNPDKVYALIEAKTGGLYMSNDAGLTWQQQNTDANIRQRAWYFNKINIDPKNENKIYICNVQFWGSDNAGKTINAINTPHGDHHNLWIDPNDGKRMIIADDGGAQISFDGGNNWSTYYNQPTSQIYRISADNDVPFNLLGGQQDNSSVRIKSQTYNGAIHNGDFSATAGGEAGYDVADPTNPDIVYGGEYAGILRRYDHRTGESRNINVWPESNIGSGAANLKYRFQWNYPLFFSPHNNKRLYAAGNCLFASEDQGLSWKKMSPDLTTDNKNYQGASGGPITKDNTTVEYYCTIFTAAESELEKGVIYTGSDDGLVFITKDDGTNWQNITPKGLPEFIQWNAVEIDPFDKGTCYLAGTCYKTNNFQPYILVTKNYGVSWQKITNGIPSQHFTRCVRADKKVRNLLYAGTEYGMYISYDGGQNWRTFQLNLPIVPITDLCIKNNSLCIATQGRAIWILDDLTTVQNYNMNIVNKSISVFPIKDKIIEDTYVRNNKYAGTNLFGGVSVVYFLNKKSDKQNLTIKVLDNKKQLIKSFTEKGKDNHALNVKNGMNIFEWDGYYDAEEPIKDMILWNGIISQGPKAVPGNYFARFIYGNDSSDHGFTIFSNPKYSIKQADYQDQFNFLQAVKILFDSAQTTIKQIRTVRSQLSSLNIEDTSTIINRQIASLKDSTIKKMASIEETLYQTNAKSGQDVLNYPIRLNDKIASLYNEASNGYTAATQQSKAVFEDLKIRTYIPLHDWQQMLQVDLKKLNQLIKTSELDIIKIK